MRRKFKKGAASFYIVAFSTLILMIIAMSFAAVVISEITRTSNDDLSQSAYDSALAGIEDAKLAFYNYQNCVAQGKTASSNKPEAGAKDCAAIMWYMNHPDCDMIGNILGRNTTVEIQETNVNNNMQQYYTCVKMQDSLNNYLGKLTPSQMLKAVKVKFDGLDASKIREVRLSWFSDANATEGGGGSNPLVFNDINQQDVQYNKLSTSAASKPPTVFLAMLQTADNFSIDDFSRVDNGRTDRGMVFLTPTDDKTVAAKDNSTHHGGYKSAMSRNIINASALVKSNDKTKTNLPYTVYCPSTMTSDYACSANVELPDPVGGKRNDDTFIFVVGIPYGKPETDFMLEFFCDTSGGACGAYSVAEGSGSSMAQVNLKGVQIEIDSTGRANDLFRRLQVRLEDNDDLLLSIMGPLELLDNGSSYSSGKNLLNKSSSSAQNAEPVTCEWNFTEGKTLGCHNG